MQKPEDSKELKKRVKETRNKETTMRGNKRWKRGKERENGKNNRNHASGKHLNSYKERFRLLKNDHFNCLFFNIYEIFIAIIIKHYTNYFLYIISNFHEEKNCNSLFSVPLSPPPPQITPSPIPPSPLILPSSLMQSEKNVWFDVEFTTVRDVR